jgi:precorrin-6Y C5,15-methyltransferase (decarboxylating)
LILNKFRDRERPLGIPDDEFEGVPERPNMITKMPVRLLTLSMLNLRNRSVFWDIGSCTGSVSVEAKLQFPHLEVIAFEKRPEGAGLLERNARRWGAPGIETVSGDFLAVDRSDLPRPDALFIGGHGGDLEAVVSKSLSVLRPGSTMVFNSVSTQSRAEFERIIAQKGLPLSNVIRLAVDRHNPIDVMQVKIEP